MRADLRLKGWSDHRRTSRSNWRNAEPKAENEALLLLATAGALDKTGASRRAYQIALMAQQAKEKAENEAFINSPLAQQNKAQTEQVAAQAQQMQSNARIQRLMHLAQGTHCGKK